MSQPETSSALAEEAVSPTAIEQCWQFVTGKRRSVLVDRSYQLRFSLVSLLFVFALLVPLNLSFYYNITSDAAALQASPELRGFLQSQDRAQFFLVLLGSLAFLCGHFVFNILETHHTAGAALAIHRHLRKIEQGRFGVTVRLRKDDNLLDLQGAFNRMSLSLRERTVEDAQELEALAQQLDGAADARETAARARQLAERIRARAV